MILYMDISDDLVLSQVKVTVPTASTFFFKDEKLHLASGPCYAWV